MAVPVPIVRSAAKPSGRELNMSVNHEDESIQPKEPETGRRSYHTPGLVRLGSVQSLVRNGIEPGSDAGPDDDCAFT